jgi:hypothetical protein
MALTTHAPFASTDPFVKTIETYRETGLGGGSITLAILQRMSMGDEVARRVISTLRMLELIDDDGRPTQNLIDLKHASSAEYKNIFADQLREAYAPVFAVMPNPGGKTIEQVTDAFRTFKPESLRSRMVTLFLGLCEYTGIVDGSVVRKTTPSKPTNKKPGPTRVGLPPKEETPPPPPPTTADSLSEQRQRYLDMLIKRAEDNPAEDLYDRIERALGIGGGSS